MTGHLPAEHGLHTIGAAPGGGGQGFVAHHTVVVALAQQRNIVGQRIRYVSIALEEAFDRHHEAVLQMPVHAKSRFAYLHVLQLLVDIGTIVVFVAHRGVGR